ncbi:protein kinase-like protein [Sinobaca qinghaiensis]|uniref:Protein kinase-like protein n=1 Tax=Sinobaca qinghaiensis TaxID=342944 RepID=A0A419V3Q1_9BACL|nr:protein kinase [Sinobaca qinghaiensis]RKD73149.1 protein kinase-like protein [Sinobaca qinghaiensis]
MIRIKNIENFLKIKLESIAPLHADAEKAILYRNFYDDISNETLAHTFSIIHSKLNDLFSFMNHKNSPGRGGHYNADASRELIDLLKEIRIILATLEREPSEETYQIDHTYQEIIEKCSFFLSSSGGSPIPDEFPIIETIDHQPIFIPAFSISIPSPVKVVNARLQLIGGGSYAQVFHYKDPNYGLDFAIKRARPELSEEELKRFEIEFEQLSKLDSPYIIKAYKYDKDKNEYTMEFSDQTLEEYMKFENQNLPLSKRKNLVGQVLRAFSYIHEKGLLHRDISYRNILLKHFDDRSSIVKISDFGLVKITESQLTRQGTDIKGTLNDYSDLSRIGFGNYSIEHETFVLAKVIYFILTGKQSNYPKEKNQALKNFVLKAISSHKTERFKSVQELHKVLNEKVYPTLS